MSAATRDTILHAAADLFAAQGFAASPLAQVGARAGVSKAAVLYHFPTKQALLAALLHPLVSDLEEYAAGHAAAGTPAERRALLGDLLVVGQRHRDACLVIDADRRSWSRTPVARELEIAGRHVIELLAGSATGTNPRAGASAALTVLFRGVTSGLDVEPGADGSVTHKEADLIIDICAATLER